MQKRSKSLNFSTATVVEGEIKGRNKGTAEGRVVYRLWKDKKQNKKKKKKLHKGDKGPNYK